MAGREPKAELAGSEHARLQQRTRAGSGTGGWLSPAIGCSGSGSVPEALSPQCPHFFRTVGTLLCLGLLCLWRLPWRLRW